MTINEKLLDIMNALLLDDIPERLVECKTILSNFIGEAFDKSPSEELIYALQLEQEIDKILTISLKYYIDHELNEK